LLVAMALAIVPLRMITEVDPGWRIPILLHAGLLVLLTLILLTWTERRVPIRAMLPVIVFALTAVPSPYQVEQALVRNLTGTVIKLTSETFILMGQPVEVLGERLVMNGDVVEVNEGCSGIRSLQSLVMAALFFGELLLLGFGRRLVLVGTAAACAVFVNTGRAFYLANVQFLQGKEAADAAHDLVGHLAFTVSAGIVFGMALLIGRRKTRLLVRTRVTRISPAGSTT
jgi:exosortase